jgi:hypothetical protein
VKKTTLAVPAGSPRVDAFVAEARVSGRSVMELAIAVSNDQRTGLAWNPLSFASARAALIEAETALGSLDELVIFADPPAGPPAIVDATPRDIEHAVLTWAAGYAELIREAAKRFGERGGGTIVLAVVDEDRGPLGSMAAGALLGLAEGLLAADQGVARYLAIRDGSGQPDLLARQVVKVLDEGSDRARGRAQVQKFGGRSGLFGRG